MTWTIEQQNGQPKPVTKGESNSRDKKKKLTRRRERDTGRLKGIKQECPGWGLSRHIGESVVWGVGVGRGGWGWVGGGGGGVGGVWGRGGGGGGGGFVCGGGAVLGCVVLSGVGVWLLKVCLAGCGVCKNYILFTTLVLASSIQKHAYRLEQADLK